MTTTTDVAVRNGHAPAQPSGALAIYADQVEWTAVQQAALVQLGLRNASDGDRLVFLHQAQRTGLDPFARQIHMIERGGKWTIQTGIDGFRVMRARAEKKAGVRGVLGQAVYIDAEGNEYRRWFKPMPPVGCEITYTVRELTAAGAIDTPYTSYLRFTEYAQYKADGKLTAKWSQSPAHMLEKCTEADVYRKAFPQDFSGVDLDDAVPLPGEDAPVQPQRQRVSAGQIRERRPAAVAEVMPEDVPPAEPSAAADAAAGPAGGTAGEAAGPPPRPPAKIAAGQKEQLEAQRRRLGYGDSEEDWSDWLADLARLAKLEALASPAELTQAEAKDLIGRLKALPDMKALRRLLDTGEVPDGDR